MNILIPSSFTSMHFAFNLSENTTLTDDVSLIERYYELYPDKNTIPKLSDNETTN